jgi:hypothetical protein
MPESNAAKERQKGLTMAADRFAEYCEVYSRNPRAMKCHGCSLALAHQLTAPGRKQRMTKRLGVGSKMEEEKALHHAREPGMRHCYQYERGAPRVPVDAEAARRR